MLYIRLALRNVRRTLGDYLIYVVTMVLAIGMFYGFFSLASPSYSAALPIAIHLEALEQTMRVAVPLVGLLVVFLMTNVNTYMLWRKQMEFAVETIIGMEQRTVALLFFVETLVIGLVAVALGVCLGMFISQLLSLVVVQAFGEVYHLKWALYPDTLLGTVLFFGVLSLGMGLYNLRAVRKMTIIEMLQRSKHGCEEETMVKQLRCWSLAAAVAALGVVLLTGPLAWSLRGYVALLVRLLLMTLLALAFLLAVGRFLARGRQRALVLMTVLSLLLSVFSLAQIAVIENLVRQRLAPPFSLTLLPFFAIFLLAFGMVSFFCGLSGAFAGVLERRPAFYWRNLFLIGQLRSRMGSGAKRMGVMACVLTAALVLFAFLPVLAIRIQAYQEVLSVYEVQVGTTICTDVAEMPKAPLDDAAMTSYLEHGGYEVSGTAAGGLYLLPDEDLSMEDKSLPILAVTLSDYNELRALSGLSPLSLAADTYGVAWSNESLATTIADFAQAAPTLHTATTTLTKADNVDCQDSVGISLFTSQTEAVYIIPDAAAQNLQMVMTFYAANTTEPLSYGFAKAFETAMGEHQRSLGTVSDEALFIRLHTLQASEGLSSMLTLMLLGAYMALVLLVSSFTMLSVQQLIDAIEQRVRFGIIRQLGVARSEQQRTIRRQMGFWFGLPVSMAVIASGGVLGFLLWRTYKDIVAYMSFAQVGQIFAIAYGAFLAIFACYFAATYYLFQKHLITV